MCLDKLDVLLACNGYYVLSAKLVFKVFMFMWICPVLLFPHVGFSGPPRRESRGNSPCARPSAPMHTWQKGMPDAGCLARTDVVRTQLSLVCGLSCWSARLILPTYLDTYLPTYLPTRIPTYLHAYIPTYLHTYIPTYLHTYIPTCLHTYILTYLNTYIPTYLHTYIPTHLHTHIPT